MIIFARRAADSSAQRDKKLGSGLHNSGPVGRKQAARAQAASATNTTAPPPTSTASTAATAVGVQVAGERKRVSGKLLRDERTQGPGGLAGREGQPVSNDSQG